MPPEQGSPKITLEQAKALVAGELGKEMEKYPARFCKPVYFGAPPLRERPAIINNGTATLLKVGDNTLALTCYHVLKKYRSKRAEMPKCFFAIANCHLDPEKQLIAEDEAIDSVVIRLTPEQATDITKSSNGIGESFYPVNQWPPSAVSVNDFLAYAGFPGDLREHPSFDRIGFGTYMSGACRVTDKHADYLTCEFERQHWIKHFGEPEPQSLGGLSGGPAFVIRHSPAGVMSYEFAGLIFRMYEGNESLYVRQAHAIPLGL